GRDAERAFRADEDAEQIVARRFRTRAAEIDHLAVAQDDARAEDVIGRRTIFQTVYAACVLRDVAADGAGRVTRRVGHVVEAVRRDGTRELRVDETGLDDGEPVLVINLQYAAHAR